MVEISCREVIKEISDYIDGGLSADLRQRIADHLRNCDHCTAVYDGTRNVIQLVCDEKTFTLPAGFSKRLHDKLTRDRT